MSTSLSRILAQENIVLDMAVQDKQDLFRQLGQLFEYSDNVDAGIATAAITEREAAGSTGLGCGVAVPHGRIAALIDASAAFVRLAEPIPFDSPDGKPVRLVIALLMPQSGDDMHLELLSEVASRFSDEGFRQRVLEENDREAVKRLFAG